MCVQGVGYDGFVFQNVCVGCQKVSEGARKYIWYHAVMYSTAWYRIYILTPYTPANAAAAAASVCRVSESLSILLHGIVCIFSHPTHCSRAGHDGLVFQHMCVGCQKVWCILLHGIVYIFSHPTHRQMRRRQQQVCVLCHKVLCILLHGIICIFSHPTYSANHACVGGQKA